MTWQKTDAAAYAADEPAHALMPVRVRANIADSEQNRTPHTSHSFSSTTGYAPTFSTPSDTWRTIALGQLPQVYGCDAIAVTIRYTLDAAGTSGISAPTTAGEVRLRVNGVYGTAATVTVTGATVTSEQIDCSTAHVGVAGLLNVEIQFRSKRGASAGTFTVYDTREGHVLACDASFTPSTSAQPHLEIDADSEDLNPPTVHVLRVDAASGGAAYDYGVFIWPHIEASSGWPFGDGKSSTPDVYKLPAWTLYGWSIRYTSSGGLISVPGLGSIGSGTPVSATTERSLLDTVYRLHALRPRVHYCGSLLTGNGQYLYGQRVDTIAQTYIAGGLVSQAPHATTMIAIVQFCARYETDRETEATFTLEISNRSGAGSGSQEVAVSTAGMRARRTPDDAGTLHQYNVANTVAQYHSPADLGFDGDSERLRTVALQVDYPGSAGDILEWRVSVEDAPVWISTVTVYDRVRI